MMHSTLRLATRSWAAPRARVSNLLVIALPSARPFQSPAAVVRQLHIPALFSSTTTRSTSAACGRTAGAPAALGRWSSTAAATSTTPAADPQLAALVAGATAATTAAAAKKKSTVRRATGADYPPTDELAPDGVPAEALTATHRAAAYCTADSYDLHAVREAVEKAPGMHLLPALADDVVHVQVADEDVDGDLFVFGDGTFVVWSRDPARIAVAVMTRVLGKRVPLVEAGAGASGVRSRLPLPLEPVKQGAEVMPYAHMEVEDMAYVEDAGETTGLIGDTILIGTSPTPALSKLAFSHGLSRSAKVAVLEGLLDTCLGSTRHVPAQLAAGQGLGLSRRQVLQIIGELLSVRALLNLPGHANAESLLDTPEYYWSKPELEEYYNRVSRWLDIKPRIAVLNQKLDYAAEFAQVLRGYSSEKHSLKLEWFIIILIAVEVAFEVVHWCEKLGYLEIPPLSLAVGDDQEPKVESV
ncbi:hypothetical protein GGF31_000063 [Allomyces arbusculus]|nr:hypothetical protein GGF31_000063 [Allomyces arbusculus]